MPKDSKQLMEIEVTFGNRSDFVIVHQGDDAFDLAKAFVKKHKLKDSSVNQICDYIEATIEDHLISNPDKDRRNTSDSNDSSFDYDNVPMRFHNPIVEVVEPPKLKEKLPSERGRLNSGDRHNSSENHAPVTAPSSNVHSSSSNNLAGLNAAKKQSSQPSPTQKSKPSESDLVRLAKQTLNAPDTDAKHPAPVPIVTERERKHSIVSNPMSEHGSATSTAPTVDLTAAHIRQSPLRIRGSDSEFFFETKGQSLPETASSNALHQKHQHQLPQQHHHHHQNHGQHRQQRSPDGFMKSMQYSASDLDLLSSLEDPNAVDHRQFQANLDRNLNSSLSNFSFRKMASEIVSSSRTPSVTSEYSQHSKSSTTRRHFGDGRNKLQKRSPTHQGIALHSDYRLDPEEGAGVRGGSDYEVDEVEYDHERSRNSNDSVLGIKEEGKHYHGHRRHSSDRHHSSQPYLVTLDPSANQGGGGVSRKGGKPVVKTANERLYNSASDVKLRQLKREQQAARELKEELEKNQFKLNEASRRMVQRLSVKSDDGGHVSTRLYTEGLREKQMKLKRADNMKGISVCEEWSCARCGKFHKITTANVVIQPLSQAETYGLSGNNASQLQNKVVKRCDCGWDQGAVESFKPVNIGLKLHDDAEGVVINRRHTSEGIHEQLFNEAREKERMHLMNQAFHEEAVIKSMSSFTPHIPSSSKSIVENYVAAANGGPLTASTNGDCRSLSASRRSAANGSVLRNSSAIVGPQLGEYFSVPAVERLSRTKTREIDEFNTLYKQPDPSLSRAHSRSRSRSRSMSRSRTGTTSTTIGGGGSEDPPPVLTKKDKFIERLVYEYKEKAEKVKDLTKSVYSHDQVTGQPLFQPVVPVLPSDIYHVPPAPPVEEGRGRKQQKQFVDNILQKDQELKLKKLKAQKEAELRELEQLKTSKAKALENSDAILKAATDRNVDDLFHLLTMQNTATDENQYANRNTNGSQDDAWRRATVDLLWVNKDVMIDEVSKLLVDIRNEKLTQLQRDSKTEILQTQKLLVNLDEFHKLAVKCIKKRDGTGKTYIYAPKKKPEVALQMIREDQKQETFRPKMDKISLELSQSRQKRLTEEPIESILWQEGDKLKNKVESARQELILKQSAEFSFQPRLYKTPAYVQARYKGVDNLGTSFTTGGGNDESMLDIELASASQGSRSASGGNSHVFDAKDFLNKAFAPPPPPPPLPSEVADLQMQSLSARLIASTVRPQPNTDYIPIQKPQSINTALRHKSKSKSSSAAVTPMSTASLRVSSSDEYDEEGSMSSAGLGSSPQAAGLSVNLSVSASSYSNSHAPRTNSNLRPANSNNTPIKKKTTALGTTPVGGGSSSAKSGKKAAAKPLPLLPFEALSASYSAGGGGSNDLRRSSAGSAGGGGGGMTIAELRKVATNRLSVDSGLTQSTSSTIVKKKK